MMKRLLLGVVLFACAPFAAAIAEQPGFDPIAAYGDRIEFEVLRNGDPIGRHTVNFMQLDDGLQVDVEMNLNVGFLGLTVYRFEYRSGSFWQDGLMTELSAFTNDDGDQTRVTAALKDGALSVSGPSGDAMGPWADAHRPLEPDRERQRSCPEHDNRTTRRRGDHAEER